MATSDPFNAVGGISVGIPAIQVIDSNGNVITSNLSVANITGGNMTITGNIMVGGIKTDNYYYSNGVPVAFGGGGGSGSTVQITSITSTAVDFTVTLPTVPVTWAVGNTVTIYNTTPTQYNGDWIIASITGTTVTVSTPINPGPSTVNGIIQSKYSTNYPVPGFDTQLIFNIGGNACASPNLRFDPVVSMLHVDGNICVEGTAIANYFSGDGSNITNVTANLANYVTQGNQSNITRLGTLLELNVAGNANLGNVGNIKIFGGTSSQILINDGSNGLVWGNGPNAISNGSSNVTIATSGGPVTISSGGVSNVVTVNPSNIVVQAVEVWVSGNVRANYFDGNGARLTNLNAANLVGAIPYAAVAGTVASNAQPNITSLGTLNSLTVSGPVNLGSVTDVTITGGAPSQVLSTDGSGGLSWVSVALSNAITDGTSAMQVYPSGDITANVNGIANVLVINEFDITSKANFNPDANNTYDLGNLTNQWRDLYLSGTTLYFDGIPIRYTGGSGGNLSVEGNVVPTYDSTNNDDLTTPANIVAIGTITSPAFFGDAGNLSNITGSNITGPVANATHAVNADDALRAGTVTTAAQPNITSVGTLTSLNSSGNITASNLVTSGRVTAVGNITGGNLVTTGGLFAGTLNITGNITGSNLNSTGNIEALGYIEGGNIFANAGTVKGAVGNFSTVVGSLLTNAQPNITSVGTLTSLTVGGNTVSGNVYANSGTVGANTVRANTLVLPLGSNIQGNLLPSANITYDLGSPTQRWKDIYLSNNTIFLGQAPIRANGDNTIVVPVLEILEGFRGNLVPVANAQYSIGAPDAQWNFVGAASIQIGNTVLEESPTGELLLGNNTIVTSTPNGSIGSNSFTALEFVETDTLIANTANITDLNATGSLDVTGNIIANGHLQVHEDSTFDGNVTIGGNLTINGNISYIDVTDLRISDPVIQQGGGPNGTPLTANDGRDRGQLLHVFDVAANTEVDKFQGWDNSANEFVFVSNAVNVNDVITINEYGNVRAGYFIGNGYALSDITGSNVTGVVANSNYSSFANVAYNVSGSNVSGEVDYAAVANSVNVSNVVGIGNISTINLDGNAYNVLRGDGTWSQDNRSLPIANGNSKLDIATIDGNVTITTNGLNTWTFDTTGNLTIPGSSGGLIKTVPNASIGVVAVDNGSGNPAQLMLWKVSDLNPDTIISAYPTNATIQTNVNGTINTWEFGHDGVLSLPGSLTAQGNLGSPAPGINGFSSISTYDGANLGNVLITKVSGQRGNIIAGNISLTGNISALNIGNIASINIDGNGGNILYGNGVFAEFPDISNSNYSNYSGNVVNSSQPNITSLGTLTGLTVDGLSSFGDVGNVSITGGNSGYVLGTDGNGNLSWIDHEPIANSVIASTNDPMGFDDATKLTSTTISFDDITRTFTISPVDSNYTYWVKGTQYISTVSQSVTIPNVSGTYYISFNDSGNLQASTTPFNFSEIAPVAYLYWNSVLSSAQFLFDERHGTSMDHATHEYLHRTRGASMSFVPSVGFVLSATTSGDGSSNTDAQIGISSGTFYDEDIEVNVVVSNTPTPNTWEQDLTNPGKIPVLYRSGSLWVLDSPTDYPIKFGVARPTYNLNTGGTWSTPDVSNNQYFVQWIVATNNLNYPVISIMGQTQFSSLSSAQESNFSDLNLSSLPIAEMRPLYGLALQTSNGYTNVIKARLRSYSDIRLFTQSIASLDVDGVDIAFRETPETVFASDATSLAAWNSYISNTIGNYSGNITFDISSISITGGNAGDIISTDGSGNLTYVAPYSLSVGNLSASNGNTFINTFSNVTTLGFDEDSGFSVDDLGNGVVKIAINSTFKFWEVNGNTGLIAEGLDTVNFIAGSGITIEANNDSSPKTFTIAATGGGGGNIGGSNTQIQYNDDGSFAGASDFTYDNTLNRVNISNTVSGATGIVLGDPALGSLVSNALTLSNSSSVSNSIAQLNAILGKLVPPSPPAYPASQSLSIGSLSTYRMANFTQTDNTPGANKSVSGGTTVTNVRRAGTYNANSIVNAGPGDNGTITVYLNGTTAGSRTLTTSLDGNGTYSNLVIYNNYDYNVANSSITPGFWSVVSTRAAGSVSSGWNEVYISHSAAGNTNTPYWYYDSSAPGTPQFSNVSIEPTTNSYTYTSTVPHYNSSSVFTLSFDVNRLSGDTYPTSDTFITGTSGGSFNAPSSVTYSSAGITIPLERNLYVSSGNVSVTTTSGIRTGFGSSSTGPSLSAFNSYATGTQAFAPGVTVLYKTGTSSTMEESNVRIGSTIGSGSGLAYRVINPGSTNTPVYSANATAFNSQTSTLEVYDATIVSAILEHDVTNYSTGYLPVGPDLSVGRSGDQYFTFKFIRTSVSKFDIKWTGTIAGLWVALPGSTIDSTSGLNGWLDLSVAYAGAGVPGSLVGGNGSDGASLGGVAPLNSAQTNKSVTATFGTVSSSSTATNEIYVRIKLTSGQTVTALSLETASN